MFPIKSYDEKTILEYISYGLGVPKYTPEECIRRGITYNVTLKVKFRLTDETGIKEEEVYMGTIPIMTDKGTFIINGAERVVVSQLHRSPVFALNKSGMRVETSFIPSVSFPTVEAGLKVLLTAMISFISISTGRNVVVKFWQPHSFAL